MKSSYSILCFLLVAIVLYSCLNSDGLKNKDNIKCESKYYRDKAYCYKWFETPTPNEYRIQIYDQTVYEEQLDPVLVLDAIFVFPFPINFNDFFDNLAYYEPLMTYSAENKEIDTLLYCQHKFLLKNYSNNSYISVCSKLIYYYHN